MSGWTVIVEESSSERARRDACREQGRFEGQPESSLAAAVGHAGPLPGELFARKFRLVRAVGSARAQALAKAARAAGFTAKPEPLSPWMRGAPYAFGAAAAATAGVLIVPSQGLVPGLVPLALSALLASWARAEAAPPDALPVAFPDDGANGQG